MKPGSKKNPFIFPTDEWFKFQCWIEGVITDEELLNITLESAYKLVYETARLNKS